MGAVYYVAMRYAGGTWQYYAGRNDALGATRWGPLADAARFATRAAAEHVAHQYDGFARRVVEGPHGI